MISLLVLFLDFFFAGLSGKGFIADRAIFSFAVSFYLEEYVFKI